MSKTTKLTALLFASTLFLTGCSTVTENATPSPDISASADAEMQEFETVFYKDLNEEIETRVDAIRVKNFELYGENNQVLIWSDFEEKSGVIFFGEDTTALAVSSDFSDWGEVKCSEGLIFTTPLYEGFNEFVVTGEMVSIDRETEDSVKILGYASGQEGVVVGYTKNYDADNIYYSGTFVNTSNEITKLVRGNINKKLWSDSEEELLNFLSEGKIEEGNSYEAKYIYKPSAESIYGAKTASEWKSLLNEIYELEIFNGLMYDLNKSTFYVASADEVAIQNGEVPEIIIKDLEGRDVPGVSCNLTL